MWRAGATAIVAPSYGAWLVLGQQGEWTVTPIAISFAIFAVAVNVALFVLFRESLAAASARRTKGMLTRLGLSPGAARLGDPRTKATLKAARQRCTRCPREDLCDRWLAGDVAGDNAFCVNARTFGALAGAEAIA